MVSCVCFVWSVVTCVFFFQAEDGIRDLVRSRGLGDVYKRQAIDLPGERDGFPQRRRVVRVQAVGKGVEKLVEIALCGDRMKERNHVGDYTAVSYTHLTLPTSDLV